MKMSCQLTSVVSCDCNKDILLANHQLCPGTANKDILLANHQLCPGTADEDVLSANISCVLGL